MLYIIDPQVRKLSYNDDLQKIVDEVRRKCNIIIDLGLLLASDGTLGVRKPPNIARWQLRNSRGKFRTTGTEVSGGTKPGRRLTWPEQQKVHTEGKILEKTKGNSKKGDILTIQGREEPCGMCNKEMEKAAKKLGIRIDYKDSSGKIHTYGP